MQNETLIGIITDTYVFFAKTLPSSPMRKNKHLKCHKVVTTNELKSAWKTLLGSGGHIDKLGLLNN